MSLIDGKLSLVKHDIECLKGARFFVLLLKKLAPEQLENAEKTVIKAFSSHSASPNCHVAEDSLL